MSNEDIVREIQAGQTELYEQLWEQTRAFIRMMALRRYVHVQDVSGIDIDDLLQSGFLALVEAVKGYDADAGGGFLKYLELHLRSEFNKACGCRSKRAARDPIHRALSLDVPVDADDPDGATFGDFQPCQDDCIAAADDKVFQEQLRAAIDRLLSRLTPKAADVLRSSVLDEEPLEQIADRYCTSKRRIAGSRNQYLMQLRALARSTPEGKQLQRFVDESTDWFRRVGPDQFSRTQTSAVESVVFQREYLAKKYLREGMN